MTVHELAVFLHWVETSTDLVAVNYRERRGSVSRRELADAYLISRARMEGRPS
jgi:hypothetical protein